MEQIFNELEKNMKKGNDTIYSVNVSLSDEKISELEALRERITEDLDDALSEYARASRKRALKPRRKRLHPLLRDGFKLEG